jgi:ribosomal protein S1
MKQIIRNIVLAAVVLAWTGFAQAEEGAAPAGAPKKTMPKGTPMQCEIVKVDAAAKTIEVKTGDKTETLALSDKVWVKINGEKKTLADLKPGDKCTCTVFDRPKEGTKSVGRIVIGEDKGKEPPAKAK